MATTRPIRAYTYELCDSIIPRDILNTLSEPPHVHQARILVFAMSAHMALQRIIDLGLRPGWDTKRPRLARGNDVTALTFAEYNNNQAVFVVATRSGNVAEVDFGSDGYRESRLIGVINPGSQLLGSAS